VIARLKLERQRTHCVEVALQIKTDKTQFHRCTFVFWFPICLVASNARQPDVALPRSGRRIFRCFGEGSR